jgi:hypothetical protein
MIHVASKPVELFSTEPHAQGTVESDRFSIEVPVVNDVKRQSGILLYMSEP